MHFIKCSEIWGGIRSADENIKTKGLTASMYCKPFESNEGGDIYYFSVCGKDILSELNEVILQETRKAITTAGIYTINNDASTLSFSTAGHPPFFMKRKDTNEWREVRLQNHTPKGNIPLGTLQGTHFDEESISVESGDQFFFLTDGLLEAFDEQRNMFGKIELLKVFKQNINSSMEKLKHAVLNALKDHVGNGIIQDDLTFIAMEIN